MIYSFDGILYNSDNEQTKAMNINIDEPPKNVMLKEKKATSRIIQIVWCHLYKIFKYTKEYCFQSLHLQWKYKNACCCCLFAKSCPTPLWPHGALPGSSAHGISQARILERIAISFSSGPSWSRDQTPTSCIDWQIHYCLATMEAPEMHGNKKY